jgi:hypothetical protein
MLSAAAPYISSVLGAHSGGQYHEVDVMAMRDELQQRTGFILLLAGFCFALAKLQQHDLLSLRIVEVSPTFLKRKSLPFDTPCSTRRDVLQQTRPTHNSSLLPN